MKKFDEFVQGLLTAILYFAVIVLLMGLPVMLLWNYVMPRVFHMSEITFWQALGLNALSSILFGPRSVKKD